MADERRGRKRATAGGYDLGGEPHRRQMPAHARRDLGPAELELSREIECELHADGDSLAMQQRSAEARRRLERVAEGVAEIEQRAQSALALVGGDDRGLGRPAG